MKLISFTKMVASGNDFVVIDEEKNNKLQLSKERIKAICNRKYGVGADGLMFIKNTHTGQPVVKFYNADGSSGALCGNGSRCIVNYIAGVTGEKDKSINFVFNDKNYTGFINSDGQPLFYLHEPVKIIVNKKIKFKDKIISGDFIDVNAPHFIINIDETTGLWEENPELNSLDIFKIGKQIRYAGEFQPEGTNVNFIRIENNNISIRTYERGVEDETLSCGTGSVSAAISAFLHGKVKPPVEIMTKSGEKLLVNFNYVNKKFNKLTLTGSAKEVFSGKFILN